MDPEKHLREMGGGAVEDRVVHDKIALTQRIIEGQNLDIRRTLWNYTSLVEKQRVVFAGRRVEILDGGAGAMVRELCPDRCTRLEGEIPGPVFEEAQRHVVLFHMDREWSRHLAAIADFKEAIHLTRLGGRSPLLEFNKLVVGSFEEMEIRIEEGVAETFERVTITDEGLDLESEGLEGPTSTWTYMVNDNPFEWLSSISAPGNMGLGIAAGLWGGLFVIREVARKIAGKRGGPEG